MPPIVSHIGSPGPLGGCEAYGGKPGVEPGNSVDVLIGSTYLVG